MDNKGRKEQVLGYERERKWGEGNWEERGGKARKGTEVRGEKRRRGLEENEWREIRN